MIDPPQPLQFPLMSSAYWNFHSIQQLVTFLELFNSFCWNIFWPPPPLSAMEMWSFTTLNWWVTMNAEILVLNCQKCKQCLKWFHVSRIALSLFSVFGFFIFFVMLCHPITLIKCLKAQESPRSFFEGVLQIPFPLSLSSLWSNVSKITRLKSNSFRVFSKCPWHCHLGIVTIVFALPLTFCWSYHVSYSLWSNVWKVISLWDHSLRLFSKCLCHCQCLCNCLCLCHCLCHCLFGGQVMSPRLSYHMSQGSQVSQIAVW